MIIPNIWKNKKCSKPPTRYVYIYVYTHTYPIIGTNETIPTWLRCTYFNAPIWTNYSSYVRIYESFIIIHPPEISISWDNSPTWRIIPLMKVVTPVTKGPVTGHGLWAFFSPSPLPSWDAVAPTRLECILGPADVPESRTLEPAY